MDCFLRALARAGNAYNKKEDYETALVFYNKSLSEHRDMDIVRKSQQVSSPKLCLTLKHCFWGGGFEIPVTWANNY